MHYKGCAIHKVADRFEVYSRDGSIHPSYAVEKLSMSKCMIESALDYYKSLIDEEDEDE